MPSEDPEFVEIVSDAPGADRSGGGPADPTGEVLRFRTNRVLARLGGWGWWAGATATERRLITVAAVLTALAAVAGLATLERPVRVERVTRNIAVPAAPSGVDALGCPIARRCAVRRPASTIAAVRRSVPQARIVAAIEVFDTVTGTVYRREVVARSARLPGTLRLVAQCGPVAATVRTSPVTVRHSFDPNTLRSSVVVERLVAPGPGCTSYAMVDQPERNLPIGAPQLSDRVEQLAIDRNVVLVR